LIFLLDLPEASTQSVSDTDWCSQQFSWHGHFGFTPDSSNYSRPKGQARRARQTATALRMFTSAKAEFNLAVRGFQRHHGIFGPDNGMNMRRSPHTGSRNMNLSEHVGRTGL
jgi:hypothetical protein